MNCPLGCSPGPACAPPGAPAKRPWQVFCRSPVRICHLTFTTRCIAADLVLLLHRPGVAAPRAHIATVAKTTIAQHNACTSSRRGHEKVFHLLILVVVVVIVIKIVVLVGSFRYRCLTLVQLLCMPHADTTALVCLLCHVPACGRQTSMSRAGQRQPQCLESPRACRWACDASRHG